MSSHVDSSDTYLSSSSGNCSAASLLRNILGVDISGANGPAWGSNCAQAANRFFQMLAIIFCFSRSRKPEVTSTTTSNPQSSGPTHIDGESTFQSQTSSSEETQESRDTSDSGDTSSGDYLYISFPVPTFETAGQPRALDSRLNSDGKDEQDAELSDFSIPPSDHPYHRTTTSGGDRRRSPTKGPVPERLRSA